MVLLQATDAIEALRLKATRLAVIKGGRVIARTAPRQTALALPDRPTRLDPARVGPSAQ
jgi:cytosine deaminase